MSSTQPNGKPLNKTRPDSGYYDRETPMEVDGTNRHSNHTSGNRLSGEFGHFCNLNGSGSASETLSSSNGGNLVLTAGMSVRSPATIRRAGVGPMGASVTRVIKTESESDDMRSTTVLRPASGGSGASVRPNYFTTTPGACNNSTDDVLGVITIGKVKDEDEGSKDQTGTTSQKKEGGFRCDGDQKPDHPPDFKPQMPIIPDPPKPQVKSFEIFVKNADGKTYTFTVMKSDTVDSLLDKIHNRLNINGDQFWLNFAGKRLTRGKALGSYGIEEHSTVFIELRLRGG